MSKFLLILTLLFSFATFIVLWMTQGEDGVSGMSMPVAESAMEEEETSVGEASVGGAFTLTDQEGRIRTDLDFRGRVMLVFFGFTHCPDICPLTIATFSRLMELLGEKANQVAPLFITVDPKRDTPETMKEYLKNFDSQIVGLTGAPRAIKDVADAYKVFYSETSDQSAGINAMEENPHAGHAAQHPVAPASTDNYQVDHSGYIYLMDKEGKYVKHFPFNASEQELLDALKPYLK